MVLKVVFSELAAEMQVDFADSDLSVDLEFEETQTKFELDFGEVTEVLAEDVPTYSGPYEVKPALESQTLETEGLLMRQDVTVEQIPIYIVSNNSGGDTVVIGG